MPYNGRAVLAEVAAKHGWSVHKGSHGSPGADGEIVAYERNSTQILIRWTPINTATFIVKNHGCADEQIADGPLGLITAREWIESGA